MLVCASTTFATSGSAIGPLTSIEYPSGTPSSAAIRMIRPGSDRYPRKLAADRCFAMNASMSVCRVPGGQANPKVRAARSCNRSTSARSARRVVIDMERQFKVSRVQALTRQLGDVIPLPVSVRPDPAANFRISSDLSVSAAPEAADLAEQLAELLRRVTGHPVSRISGEDAASFRILLERDDGNGKPAEAYGIEINPESVTLRAGSNQGLFAALQTLRQLLPEEPAGEIVLPGGRIEDEPRFAYRSAMLDLARHFFGPAEIRSFIDAVAQVKINHLHLHLTDDQGWRLEIPGWPRLTEIGGGPGTGVDGAGPGFLTAQEYADLVAYAAARFITVVPEIDMPGHVNV